MADSTNRYVRNRTGQPVFLAGHGVLDGDFEGEVTDSDAVSALVGQGVLSDAKPPAKRKQNTNNEEGNG